MKTPKESVLKPHEVHAIVDNDRTARLLSGVALSGAGVGMAGFVIEATEGALGIDMVPNALSVTGVALGAVAFFGAGYGAMKRRRRLHEKYGENSKSS